MIIGSIQQIELDETMRSADGFVALQKANTLASAGLDACHEISSIDRLSFARPFQPKTKLQDGWKKIVMSNTGILFPHQLFEYNTLISTCNTIYLIEEELFFRQYNYHKQKIAFHRASMKFYEDYLQSKNITVVYIDAFKE